MTTSTDNPQRRRRSLNRLGWLGFAFFTAKGLAWLTVPALLAWCAGTDSEAQATTAVSGLFVAPAAILLNCTGMALCYLGHPNQALLERPRRHTGWFGLVMMLAAMFVWIDTQGLFVGIAVALTLAMLTGAALPYLATWRRLRRKAAGARAPAFATVKERS